MGWKGKWEVILNFLEIKTFRGGGKHKGIVIAREL